MLIRSLFSGRCGTRQLPTQRRQHALSSFFSFVLALAFPALADTPASAAETKQRRVALVIGVSDHGDARLNLKNPANDARRVASALRSVGFDVSGPILNPRLRDMRAVIAAFADKAKGADAALFFYAGHGFTIQGLNHLVPHDFNLSGLKRDLKKARSLALSEVISKIEAAQTGIRIFILDACRNDPNASEGRSILADMRDISRAAPQGAPLSEIISNGFKIERARGNTFFGFSTEPGTRALDGDGAQNSPFTTAFLKHLERPGLSLDQLFKRVRSDVLDMTEEKQRPWNASQLRDDFILYLLLERRDIARRMQTSLNAMKCLADQPDGAWGPRSRAALQRFNTKAKTSLNPNNIDQTMIDLLLKHQNDGLICDPPPPAVVRSSSPPGKTSSSKTRRTKTVRSPKPRVVRRKPAAPTGPIGPVGGGGGVGLF